jgi:hypothetical protein
MRVHWDLHPLALFAGRLKVSLETNGDLRLRTTLALGRRYLSLQQLDAQLPAASIPAFFPPATLLSPTGTLHISTDDFAIESGRIQGGAQIQWLSAGARIGGLGELGDYLLTVNGKDGPARLHVDTQRGEIKVTADGEWRTTTDGGVQLNGTVAPGARDAALQPLLTLMQAQRDGDHYRFANTARITVPAFLAPQR